VTTEAHPREQLYQLCREKLGLLGAWRLLEPEIALQCANLTDNGTEQDKTTRIAVLTQIKTMLVEHGLAREHLEFLDAEIELARNAKQITLYQEKDDYVDEDTIKRHVHISMTNEGIIGIPGKWTFGQCRRITNGVYKYTGLVKLFVSKEVTFKGRIIAEFFDNKQEIPICSVLKPKKDDVSHINIISLFGDSIDAKKFNKLREVTALMHAYRFLRDNGVEYVLLSSYDLEVGEYEIDGTVTTVNDNKSLTDSAKMMTKMPFFFCNEARPTVVRYATEAEYREHIKEVGPDKTSFFNYPFYFSTHNNRGETHHVARHPKWFKWLVWAWLCHKEKGDSSKYPLHIAIVAPPNSGKSLLMNSLHRRTMEYQPAFTGAGSTIKEVVPSFHSVPPKPGYFALSHRYAYLDEFFRCVTNIPDEDKRAENLARMNDLLEHQRRTYGSGKGSITVTGTARALMANNPPRGVRTVDDLFDMFDGSFLSRILIYFQDGNDEHFKLVRQAKLSDCPSYEPTITPDTFVGFLDYVRSFHAQYDLDRVMDIYERVRPLLTERQRDHYEARHKHHIECVMDGIIKARAIISHTAAFWATEQDYEVLDEVWSHVIRSWIRGEQVKQLPLKDRIKYLPESCQWLYRQLVKSTSDDLPSLSRGAFEEMALKGLNRSEFYAAVTILREHKVIIDNDTGSMMPYWRAATYVEAYDVPQSLLLSHSDEDMV